MKVLLNLLSSQKYHLTQAIAVGAMSLLATVVASPMASADPLTLASEDPKALHTEINYQLPHSDPQSPEAQVRVEMEWIPVGSETATGATLTTVAEELREAQDQGEISAVGVYTDTPLEQTKEANASLKSVVNALEEQKLITEEYIVPEDYRLKSLVKKPILKPTREEVYLGIVRGFWSGVSSTYVYFFKMKGLTPEIAAGMAVLQTVLSVTHSVWARTFDRVFLTRLADGKERVNPRTEFFRRQVYSIFLNELFRWIAGEANGIPPLFSIHGQLNVLTFVALSDTGAALLSGARARAYAQNPKANARFNFLSFILTAPICFMEANHVSNHVLMSIGFYDLTDTSVLLLATNLALTAAVKYVPKKVSWLLVDLPELIKNRAQQSFAEVKAFLKKPSCSGLLSSQDDEPLQN